MEIILDPTERQRLAEMRALLAEEITASGGAIPFRRYMELALYAPGLGYYVGGAAKFGAGGDFVTAPELSPLFGRTLANPAAELLNAVPGGEVLEFGAGSGRLAADLLAALERLGALPARYLILEPSPELRDRQRATLAAAVPRLLGRVEWLDRLPERFSGLVVANEVLDAMPVERFRITDNGPEAMWVTFDGDDLRAEWRPAGERLAKAVAAIEGEVGALPVGYESEWNPNIGPWVAALGAMLERGLVLLIDYGYPRPVYYHPQRERGTLRCHFRHQVVDDPLLLPGLQDITAHVDFTAVAEAADAAGLERLGYANQASWLLGCGLDRLLSAFDPDDPATLDQLQAARRLLLPQGMGEVFKVMALGRGVEEPMGFSGP